MSDIITSARWVVRGTADRERADIVEDGAVLSSGGVITAVGTLQEMQRLSPQASHTHYADHVMLPGFVNAHHHVGMTPLQLGSPDHALELWFASRIPARKLDLYLDTLYSAFEMVASGITTVSHIHGWMSGGYQAVHGAATKVLDAYRAIGMRASYSYAVREQNRLVYEADADFCARLPQPLAGQVAAYLQSQAMSFEEFMALFDQLTAENAGQDLTRIQLAPANLHWVTDDSLVEMNARSLRHGVPMHMHLLETAYQKEYARRRTGKTAVRHLYDLGVLSPRMTLGHGVWLNQEDIEIAADTGTCICHNCSSNFRLRSGIAPLNRFAAHGLNVAMGLDEAGINDDRDMLQEMRLVLRAHRVPGMDDADVPSCPQVLRMATEGGANTTAFGAEIGRLDEGRRMDAVLINWKTATYPFQDPDIPLLDAVIQRARQNAVDAVLVNGEAIYENGKFRHVDRDAVLEDIARHYAAPRTAEETARRQMGLDVFPHVKAFYDGYLDGERREPFYGQSSRV